MILFALISLLGLAAKISASVTSAPLSKESQLSTLHLRDLTTAEIHNATSPNGSSLAAAINIDPRFEYKAKFANQILDKNSTYLNTLSALADLSTKGWTPRLRWDEIYSFSSYGDVTIRIHASQNPSNLQYRFAIWGLYRAIREISTNKFKECVLTLYWSPIFGGTRHLIGYVSILGPPSLSIDTGNSTEDALELALPTQAISSETTLDNVTTTTANDSNSFTVENKGRDNVRFDFNLEVKPLDIDAVFLTIYTGIIELASLDQSQRITHPGFTRDSVFRTYLRWDALLLVVEPRLEPRFLIQGLSELAFYMNKWTLYREARFTVIVDEIKVGLGWLYRNGVSNEE